MAWFDIAAGLAQGAQQGIDRVQADQVRRKADAFKDAQEKRALAAEARVVEQDVERKIAEFIERSDPNSLDPVEVQKFGGAAQRYIQKTSDGRLVPRESPLTAQERKNKALVAGDFEAAFGEQKLARADAATQRGNVAGAKRKLNDPEWMRTAPDSQIRTVWMTAGYRPEDVDQFLSPEGRQRSREMMPAYIQSTITAASNERASRYTTDRSAASDEMRYRIAQLNATGDDKRAQGTIVKSILQSILKEEPELGKDPAALQERLKTILDAAGQYSSAPPSTGPSLTPQQQAAGDAALKALGY